MQALMHNTSRTRGYLYSIPYILFYIIAYTVIQVNAISPSFLTTLTDCQTGTAVLTVSLPTTSNGFDTTTTVITFPTSFSQAPNVALGLSFLSSTYTTTTSLQSWMIDLSVQSTATSTAVVLFNRTTGIVTQIAINYLAVLPTAFLEVTTSQASFVGTTLNTLNVDQSRSRPCNITYRSKSNSSNAIVMINTAGLSTSRQSVNTYSFTATVTAKYTDYYEVTVSVGAYNTLSSIRIFGISYQSIATTISPPLYLSMGYITDFSGTITDSSGVTGLTETGTIYTGMTYWSISDSNGVNNYNFTLSINSYTLTSTSLTSCVNTYTWYRQQTCIQYYYLSSHSCNPCDITCSACTGPLSTQCSQCPSTRSYNAINRTCTCLTGYIDQGARDCVLITCNTDLCRTCANLNQCGSCYAFLLRVLNGTQCSCMPYRYDHYILDGSPFCDACHYSCYTCTSASSTSCTSCNSARDNRALISANSTCRCINGYYDSGVTICPSCNYTCATCNSLTACTSCNSTFGRVFDSTGVNCICVNGKYDNRLTQQCSTCKYTCETCSDGISCLTCPSTRYLANTTSNNQCVCLNGYYDNGISSQCLACQYTCSSCLVSTSCTTCSSTMHRQFNNITFLCKCSAGYYDDGSNQLCANCHLTCLACTGPSDYNCTSCLSATYRSLSLSGQCLCSNGYYAVDNATKVCASCYYTCATCVNATACTSCSSTKYRAVDPTDSTKCICVTGYYDEGNQLCLACPYYCLTCTNYTSCLTCDTATRNISNSCTCLDGYYDNGVSSSCQPCLAECVTCNNGFNCTSCTAVIKYLESTGHCKCSPGYLQPSCTPCSYQCQQCSVTADNCVACDGLKFRSYVFDNTTNKGTCICYQGYYSDNTNALCKTCPYSCLTCTNSSACTSCPQNRQFDVNNQYCVCVAQFYQNSQSLNCLPCHYSCANCSEYSICTLCDSAKFRILNALTKLCSCTAGYYDDGSTELCYSCAPSCLTCTAYQICTSCDAAKNRLLNNVTNKCPCKQGYYESTSDYLCYACDYSCLTCFDITSCSSCVAGRVLDQVSRLCRCADGTFQNITTRACQACSYPCQTCASTQNTCLSCQSTHLFLISSSSCYCPTGTFQNMTRCVGCLSTCSSCVNNFSCASCRPSDNRRLVTVSNVSVCSCLAGFHDQTSSLVVCIACDYSCATCTNNASCTSCADIRLMFNGTNGYCSCPPERYYDDGINAPCLVCSYLCLSCNKISTNCTSCNQAAYRYLNLLDNSTNTSTCSCLTGYYGAGIGVETCLPCQYSCNTCLNSTSCLTCNISLSRTLNPTSTTYCSCLPGFYDVTNMQACQACSYTCLTCSQASTYCLTCPPTRNFTSNACPCENGLFDNPSPNNSTCISCLYMCATCADSSSCLSCPATRTRNSSFLCPCISGYYDTGINNLCQLCSPTCEECSDYQTCTKCFATQLRIIFNSACICQAGYYDMLLVNSSSTNYTCQPCDHGCQRCQNSLSCSSCDSNIFRIRDVNTGFCKCIDGYYDNGIDELCLPCSFDCLKCTNGTSCLECPAQRTLDIATGRCLCSSATYTNGSICQSCPTQCLTCNSSSVCTSCNNPTQRTLIAGACTCNSLLYPITNTAQCSGCLYSCASCVSYPFCSSCSSAAHRYLSAKQCLCLNKYYDDLSSQACQPCHYSCLTCTNITACLSCDSTLERTINASSLFCSCNVGFYEDPALKTCVGCHYSCYTCSGPNTCTLCSPSSMRVLNSSSCVCPSIGYFDKVLTPTCATCDPTCYTCSGLATTCTNCNSNVTFRVLTPISTCVCQSGYFQQSTDTVICSTCSYKCLTCSSPSTQCTSCSINNNRDNSTLPACACMAGYFDNGLPQCQLCDYRCQTCLDSYTCTTCNNDTSHRKLNLITLICECVSFYFQPSGSSAINNSVCRPCRYSCLTCNHETLCLTCDQSNNTRYFNNGQCLCTSGYYDNGVNIKCLPCSYYCETCTSALTCETCNILNNRQYNPTTRLCNCLRGYYDAGNGVDPMCYPCQQSCYTCTNSTGCQTCYPLTNKYINATQGTNYCICLYGYFEVAATGICNICHYSCERCVGQATSCTACDARAFRSLVGGSCPCNSGYFDDGRNQLCLLCTTNCINCFGTNPGQCLRCRNGTYLLNGICYLGCPSYYYPISSTWTCGSCPNYCTNCTSNSACDICQSGFYLIPSNLLVPASNLICTNQCPDLYYHNTTACLKCISPCNRCTGLYVCTDCIQQYFLDNGTKQCYPCYPTCRYCTSSSALSCISCIDSYFLNSSLGLCVKMTCASSQYVHSVYGCYSCQNTYPNSLQCNANQITSCVNGYMLTTNSTTGVKQCVQCSKIAGYTLVQSTGLCEQICGDGIHYDDPCDDGNTLNGDGCSSICRVQTGWDCSNSSICTISKSINPSMTVSSVTKIIKQNKIIVILNLNIGIRFVKQNFRLKFGNSQNFDYNITALNAKYTQYQITVQYYQTIASSTLSISVISPINSTSGSLRNLLIAPSQLRVLQSASIGVSISLTLSVDIQVITTPPAVYYSPQSQTNYQSIFYIIMIVLHVIALLICLYFTAFLRLKIMLFTIEFLNFFTILYIYATYGMWNIFQLSPEASRALQHFIYKFGEDLPASYAGSKTSAGYFGFGGFVLAGCIIQLVIIAACIIAKTIFGGLSSSSSVSELQQGKRKYDAFRYYHLSFIFAFAPQLLLCCVVVFKWIIINNSIQSAYSWGIASIIFVMILIANMMYVTYSYPYAKIIAKTNKKSELVSPLVFNKTKAQQKQKIQLSKQKNQPTEDGRNNNLTVNFVTVEEALEQIKQKDDVQQNVNNALYDPFAEEEKLENKNDQDQISEKSSANFDSKSKSNKGYAKRKSNNQQQQYQNKTQAVIFDNQQRSQGEKRSYKNLANKRKGSENIQTASERSHRTQSTTISQIKRQQLIPLFDLTPSDATYASFQRVNISYHRLILHYSYLPFKCTFVSLFICIVGQIQEPIPRCSLLAFAQVTIIVYLCISMRIKNFRTINLIITTIILLSISICGLIGGVITTLSNTNGSSSQSLNILYILEAVQISLIFFGVAWNCFCYILQVVKSNQFRQYRAQVKNKQIIQKNIRRNRLRGITAPNQQVNQSFGTKNIFSNLRHQSIQYDIDRIDTKQHLRLDSQVNTPAEFNDNTTSNILMRMNTNSDKKRYDIEDIEDAENQLQNNMNLKMHKKLKATIQEQKGGSYNTQPQYNKIQNKGKEKQFVYNSLEDIQMLDDNLQQTRVNDSKAIKKNVRNRQIKLQKSNNFMDMLQNQMKGQENNQTIMIMNLEQNKRKIQQTDKDNTLISYKGQQSRQESQQKVSNKQPKHLKDEKSKQPAINNEKQKVNKKGSFSIIRDLIPTREHEQEKTDENKKNKKVLAYFSEQKEGSQNRNQTKNIEMNSSNEQQEQQEQNQQDQQILQSQKLYQKPANQRVKEVAKNKSKDKEKVKKTKNKNKIKKTFQNPKDKLKHKQQQLNQQEQQNQYQNQIQISPSVHKKPKQTKIKKDDELPKGLKNDGFQDDYEDKLTYGMIKKQMKIPKQQNNKGKSPGKKAINLKRIDSISSIGQEDKGYIDRRRIQFGIRDDESEQSEGMTVFKKILQDYQIYKDKKVKPNFLRKKQ